MPQGYDIDPVSDNNPFFYKFETGLPKSVSLVLGISALSLLLVAGIPLFRQLDRPLLSPGNRPNRLSPLLRIVLLFSFLGAGFMLIEISLMQRFSLFLGSPPVLSLAVLLSSLLAGAGMGGLWSKRPLTLTQMTRGIARASLCVAVIVLGYAVVLPLGLNQLLGLSFAVRIAIAAALLPLGFCMGISFPTGIRLLQDIHMEPLIPWMWGVNGLGSVLGSALTIAVAIRFGFVEALIISATLYLAVFVLFHTSASAGRPQKER